MFRISVVKFTVPVNGLEKRTRYLQYRYRYRYTLYLPRYFKQSYGYRYVAAIFDAAVTAFKKINCIQNNENNKYLFIEKFKILI
jgi:hypothetical protein